MPDRASYRMATKRDARSALISKHPAFQSIRDRLAKTRADRAAVDADRVQQQQEISISGRHIPKLHDFLTDAWRIVLHPSETFKSGWYIELICEYLTLLTAVKLDKVGKKDLRDRILAPYGCRWENLPEKLRTLNKLVVNISPRCSKSTIVTVIWPCWEWLTMPWLPIMGLSYAQSLASDHNDDRRSVVTSEWYQELCGGMKLSSSKNRITEFKNDSQGLMFGKGLDSAVTGVGAITLMWDDPNNPTKVESSVIRDRTTKDFKDYTVTRLNDSMLASQVVVQQRTHELDISGVLSKYFSEQWLFVIIPMEAEEHEHWVFPLSGRVFDRAPGELMAPDRFTPDIIEGLKLDQRIWAGRYQQRPQVLGGGMFKIRNWRLYNPDRVPTLSKSIIAVDATFDDTEGSDFAVGLVASKSRHFKSYPTIYEGYSERSLSIERAMMQAHQYYLRDIWRAQADIDQTKAAIEQLALKHPYCLQKVVEKKANGAGILTQLSKFIRGMTPWDPGRDNKLTRAAAVQPIQSRTDVHIPIAPWAAPAFDAMGVDSITIGEWWDLNKPPHESSAEHAPVEEKWVKFIDELALFPASGNDDQVDALSMSLSFLEDPKNSSPDWIGDL